MVARMPGTSTCPELQQQSHRRRAGERSQDPRSHASAEAADPTGKLHELVVRLPGSGTLNHGVLPPAGARTGCGSASLLRFLSAERTGDGRPVLPAREACLGGPRPVSSRSKQQTR